MQRKRISKKGIDEKIATILLVGLVISLIAMAFLWGGQLIKSRASKQIKLGEKQYACNDLAITVKSAVKTGNTLLVEVENKRDIVIEKITFKVGNGEEAKAIDSFDLLSGLEIKRYEVNIVDSGIESISDVDVIPWIKVAKSNFVPCSQKHVLAIIS